MKRKILFDTETTGALSGFGKYGRELLSRLYKHPQLEIAEFASFGSMFDGKFANAKWLYYPNEVPPQDPRNKELESNPKNKFGMWRYDKVLLDFKPDIVVSWRDPWMMEHIFTSPLRPFYHATIMPTVDSVPQQPEWMEMFREADAVFTYADWAIPEINKQTAGQAQIKEACYCGIDLDIFKPRDKKKCRQLLGLPEDCFIIGMVSRNQIRKLYPELFKAFRIFLDKYQQQLNKPVYLLLHTSYPDVGWELPELLNETGIGNRVFFTTKCVNSGEIKAIPFQGTRLYSEFTDDLTRVYPSVGQGYSDEELAYVFNCMDLYVQYANCLGKYEEIRTKDGWKPIYQVKLGDFVWTHKHRWRKVINTWYNLDISKNEPFKEISVWGDYETLLCTSNHKIYSLTHDDFGWKPNKTSLRKRIGKEIRKNDYLLPIPTTKETNSLSAGDFICYPIDDTVINQTHVPELNNIKITPKLCEFLGLLVADGTIYGGSNKTCHYFGIISNEQEIYNQELAKWGLQEIGLNPQEYPYPKKHAIDIRGHNKSLVYDNLKFIYDDNHEKKLPEFCLYLNPEFQKFILKGLFIGDGNYCKSKNVSRYDTVSKTLANQIKFILQRLRINYNVCLIERKNKKNIYRLETYGNIQNEEFITNKNSSCSFYYNNCLYNQIKNIIDDTIYDEGRYNLEVEEDHSMVTRIGVTPQCEGQGIGALEAAACGIPVAAPYYSAMIDSVDKTNGIALKPAAIPRDFQMKADRVAPDNENTAYQFYKFLSLNENYKLKKSEQAREGAEKYFNWDVTANKWINHFLNLKLTGLQGQWNYPHRLYPNENFEQVPPNLPNLQYIAWCLTNLAKRPDLISKYLGLKMLHGLNVRAPGSLNHQQIAELCVQIGKNNIIADKIRVGEIPLQTEDFIEFAHTIRDNNE